MRRSLRMGVFVLSVLGLGATAGTALAATPESGFMVFKDLRASAVTEIRDAATGRVVQTVRAQRAKPDKGSACGDPRNKSYARWRTAPTYLIDLVNVPGYLAPAVARSELVRAQEAWEGAFTTDCKVPHGKSVYNANDGGNTDRLPTLVSDLVGDGVNSVGFVSLAGTVCDGALACVVADFDHGRINEADLALERDLTRYGFQDFWTTERTTWTDAFGGEFALSDVGTHEFGHFAGLDHVEKSPELTMYPFIHDGDDTLGLGDMKGILAQY